MSASAKLSLQHDRISQPLLAIVVAIAAIAAGIALFVHLVGAEAHSNNKNASSAPKELKTASIQVSESSSSDVGAMTSSNRTQVTVNGQDIPADKNGSVHKTIVSDDGNSTVNVSVDNHSEVIP